LSLTSNLGAKPCFLSSLRINRRAARVSRRRYGGAYAHGKTSVSVHYDGIMARAKSRRKPREEWLALRPGTHEGYVDWERSEAIRRMVSDNIPNSVSGEKGGVCRFVTHPRHARGVKQAFNYQEPIQ
jgi:hypothetical protein